MSEKNGNNGSNSNGNGSNGARPAHSKKTAGLQVQDAAIAAQKVKFIEVMRKTHGLVSHACKESGLARRTAYNHLASDPAFAEAWLESTEIASDALYSEAYRRALQGEIKYSVVRGKRRQYREKSDTLLIFLIKQHDNRIKWRQRITQTGNEALKAVRECASTAGLTEDQVQQVQDAIMAKFKNISLV